MRATLLPRRKRKQISELQVCLVIMCICLFMNTIVLVIVRFIMNTPRLSNVIVTDLKFTDLFSFSSGDKSSPHNISSLEAEGLYQRIPRCIHTNTVHRTYRIEDCPCTMYRRSRFSAGHIPVFSRSCNRKRIVGRLLHLCKPRDWLARLEGSPKRAGIKFMSGQHLSNRGTRPGLVYSNIHTTTSRDAAEPGNRNEELTGLAGRRSLA